MADEPAQSSGSSARPTSRGSGMSPTSPTSPLWVEDPVSEEGPKTTEFAEKGVKEEPEQDASESFDHHWWPSSQFFEGERVEDPLASEEGQELRRKWQAMKDARMGYKQGEDKELNAFENEIALDLSEQTIFGGEHGVQSGGGFPRHTLFAKRLAAVEARRASSQWIDRLFHPNPDLVIDLNSPSPSTDSLISLSTLMSLFPQASEAEVKDALLVAAERGIYVDARVLLESEEMPLWEAELKEREKQERVLGKGLGKGATSSPGRDF